MTGRKSVLYLRNVPKPLHDLFKSACYRRGTNMTQEIVKFMDEYVKKDGKVTPPRKFRIKK
jgi:hypothetical protein